MKFAPGFRPVLTGLLLLVFCLGMMGTSGFIYAADRAVVGELYSADG